MTDPILWTLVALQIFMGAFDMIVHHEFSEKLAWRGTASTELILHAVRNIFYALLFFVFAFWQPQGWWALLFMAIMLAELFITLWDFVEEDISRKLPATERVAHTLLSLNYGAILVLVLPVLAEWIAEPSAFVPVDYGWGRWFLTFSAIAVGLFALRDLAMSRRVARLREDDAAGLASALLEGAFDATAARRHVLVTGGTGFIGSRLCQALAAGGHHVIVLTRDPAKAADLAAPHQVVTSLDQLAADTRIDAIVNLAGEPIANAPWTRAKRRRIVLSRVRATRDLRRLVERLKLRPEVLISGSAIGWYGPQGDEPMLESHARGAGFAAKLCEIWEREANSFAPLGIRVVKLRIGLVLGRQGGMLANMLPAFDLGLGGPLGSGAQWMSWIERDDLVRLICHAMAHGDVSGPVNATAPNPLRGREFAKALGRALHRPALLPVPAWPLRFALRDLAEELLLTGQRVLPGKALASGFHFRHGRIDEALAYCAGAAGTKSAPAASRAGSKTISAKEVTL